MMETIKDKVCPNCGSEIRMDEWGVYCTKCKWIGE